MFNLTIPTPKNEAEAIAQANRYDRAQQILAEGYTFSFDTDHNCIYVCKPGRLSFEYCIYPDADNIMGRAGCDCPDSQKGFCCKHTMVAKILQDEAEQVAQYEEMIANGYTE